MKFVCFSIFITVFYLEFSHGFRINVLNKLKHGQEKITTEAPNTPIPIITRFKDMNQLSKDMMHHDYVGVGIDGTAILETFKLKWPVKIATQLTNKVLRMTHPVYLKVFPGAKGKNETLMDSIFSLAQNGPKLLGGAMKVMDLMSAVTNG